MALKSMTGFSRVDGTSGNLTWHWECRSVNGRGLDIRVRLPNGYERLEPSVREACAGAMKRGNCSLNLTVKRQSGENELRLNEDAFAKALTAVTKAKMLSREIDDNSENKDVEFAPVSIENLLSLRGVLDFAEIEESEDVLAERHQLILSSLQSALDGIVESRKKEGAKLAEAIERQLNTIEELVEEITHAPARDPKFIRNKLAENLKKLIDGEERLDPERLHQEAVLLATKNDVEEELERLKAHISNARDLIRSDEAVGRRLEFLSQEFNREANTICSKASDQTISRLGLEAKAIIDQMREQVQNVE